MKIGKFVLRCPIHPTFQAVRPPRADCEVCKELWKLSNEFKLRKELGAYATEIQTSGEEAQGKLPSPD